MLQEAALGIAKRLNNDGFKASNGWLESFKNRHQIVWSSVSREANGVDMSIVQSWHSRITDLTKGFQPCDIYNADKTGFFFRAIPTKTFKQKGEKYVRSKQSKERITVLVCGNMAGELEKLMVIG